MQFRLVILALSLFFLLSNISSATPSTARTPQFSNDKISIWETVIYPSANQILRMHRHEHDRVVVAFRDGLINITSDKGKVHYLELKKNKAY